MAARRKAEINFLGPPRPIDLLFSYNKNLRRKRRFDRRLRSEMLGKNNVSRTGGQSSAARDAKNTNRPEILSCQTCIMGYDNKFQTKTLAPAGYLLRKFLQANNYLDDIQMT